MKAWKLAPLAIAMTSVSVFAAEPVGMVLGNGLTFYPSIEVNIENNDNIYLQSDNEESSTITRIAPALALSADLGKVKWSAAYTAEQGNYSADEDDDYLDQTINAGGQFELTSRYQLNINAAYVSGHDDRGAGTVEGAGALNIDPDEYDEITAGANLYIGIDSAPLNFDVYTESYQKRYSNNKDVGTEERDHNKLELGVLTSYAYSSATNFLVEARQTDISYETNSDISRQREGGILKLLAGLSWDITGKTTGELKVGSVTRDFDADIDSDSRFTWESNLIWQPMTYSSVSLFTSQNANETNGQGTYIANSFSALSWNHQFSTFISAGVEASVSADEYVGDTTVNGGEREDTNTSYGLNVTYSPRTWVDVTASFKQSERNSNSDALDYDATSINIGVNVVL